MEPNSSNRITDLSLPAGSAIQMPVEEYQPIDDNIKQTQAFPKSPSIQLTPQSPEVKIKRNEVLAMHWLNPPHREGSIMVPHLYKVLETMAFNYQREHDDSFFAQYPGLLVLSDSESSASLSMEQMRKDYKKYSMRAANRLFLYMEAATMYTCALANLAGLSRLKGRGVFSETTTAFKLANILARANLYPSYPKPMGLEAYVMDASKYAVGRTTYQADIVSFYLWRMSIYGNVGDHSQAVDELFASDNHNGLLSYDEESLGLSKIMRAVIAQYAYKRGKNGEGKNQVGYNNYVTQRMRAKHNYTENDYSSIDTKVVDALPVDPFIENGASIVAIGGSKDGNGFTNLSLSKNAMHYVSDTKISGINYDGSNLVHKVWDSFMFWQNYIQTYFSDFSDPESDWHKVFVETLKVLEPSMKVDAFCTKIRMSDAYDMQSMAECMKYKLNNNVNTATLVKFTPILDTGKAGTSEMTLPGDKSDTWFKLNYERYDPVDKSAVQYLQSTQDIPKLTPTVVPMGYASDTAYDEQLNTYGGVDIHVVNGTECFSPMTIDKGKTYVGFQGEFGAQHYPARSVTGKFATLLDVVSCANISPDTNAIETIGISPDAAKDFISMDDGIVFEEYPIQPFTPCQRLLDNTDIYQCGFNVVIDASDTNANEWNRVYQSNDPIEGAFLVRNSDEYPKVSDVVIMKGYDADKAVTQFENLHSITTVAEAEGKAKHLVGHRAVTMNKDYMNDIHTAFIFVGAGVFDHPYASGIGSPAAGLPTMTMWSFYGDKTTQTANLQGAFTKFITILNSITSQVDDDTSTTENNFTYMLKMALSTRSYKTTAYANGTIPEHNSMGLISGCMTVTKKEMADIKHSFNKFAFNPSYGPVKIFCYPAPADVLFSRNMVGYDFDASEDVRASVTGAPVRPKLAIKTVAYSCKKPVGTSAGERIIEYQMKSLNVPIAWSQLDVAQFYLWFIDQIKWSGVHMDEFGAAVRDSSPSIVKGGFSTVAKSPITTFARSKVNFPGVEDTIPFWSKASNDSQYPKQPAVSTTSFMNTNDLVVVPFKKPANVNNRQLRSVPNTKPLSSAYDNVTDGFTKRSTQPSGPEDRSQDVKSDASCAPKVSRKNKGNKRRVKSTDGRDNSYDLSTDSQDSKAVKIDADLSVLRKS